jgi:hypothetical protein
VFFFRGDFFGGPFSPRGPKKGEGGVFKKKKKIFGNPPGGFKKKMV